MRHKKLKLVMILLLELSLCGLKAQETFLAGCGEASGTGGSGSYSIGQVVYIIKRGAAGSVVEGVQQPYEISIVTGILEAEEIRLIVSIYPNPTTNLLTLKVENYSLNNLRYHLYDIQGKLLESKIVAADETNIVMDKFTPATYLLKVIHNNEEVKTFIIIKR